MREDGAIGRAVSSTPSVTPHRENAKKSGMRHRKHHPPIDHTSTSPAWPARVQPPITQLPETSKKNFYLCVVVFILNRKNMDGLKVKDGRLINNRPDPVIGLYEMGRANKAR